MRNKYLILATATATAAAVAVAVIALTLSQSRSGPTLAPTAAQPSRRTTRLTIANYAFAPAALTVTAGASITIKNTDSTAHTATGRTGTFDSGTLNPGQSTHFTLSKAGTYTYYCQFHAFMTGTIKVVD